MATIASPTTTRVLNSTLARKIMSGDEAAALIQSGDQVGMSGFTESGYPKAVPIELARRIADANFRGQKFQVKHTPHLLTESLGWHNRYLRGGKMRPQEEN